MSMIVKTDDLKFTGVTKSYTHTADSGNKNTGAFVPTAACASTTHLTTSMAF